MKTACEEAVLMVEQGIGGLEFAKRLRAEGRELKRLREAMDKYSEDEMLQVTRAERAEAALAAIIEKNAPEIEKINNHLNEMQAALAAAVAENDALAGLNQDQFLELEYLRPIFHAAKKLYDEAEEYDFPDGGMLQELWDALADAFEPKTEAIDAAIKAAAPKEAR